jgi:hypothetical protein
MLAQTIPLIVCALFGVATHLSATELYEGDWILEKLVINGIEASVTVHTPDWLSLRN